MVRGQVLAVLPALLLTFAQGMNLAAAKDCGKLSFLDCVSYPSPLTTCDLALDHATVFAK